MKVWVVLSSFAVVLSACAPASNSASTNTSVESPTSPMAESLPGGTARYNRPWENSGTSIVIDAYSGNAIDWNAMAKDPRVAGVIHRASSGLKVDSQYFARKTIAQQRGYLWGAFHLGTSDDPIAQAKLFLQTVGDDSKTLMALDLEDTDNSKMMNIANAVLFMNYVYQQTQRVPVVYANNNVTLALNDALSKNALFSKARFWYARFVPSIASFPVGIWSTYFFWQFSSEINCAHTGTCLYNVPGTSYDMDINTFYGSKTELAAQWN